MKKLIGLILIMFCIFSLNVQAQSGLTKTLTNGQFIYEYTGTATDTNTVTWTKAVYIPLIQEQVVANTQVKVHNNGSAKANISLLGKVFSTDTYTSIATLYYAGGQDTVINFPIAAAAAPAAASSYRYFQLSIAATADEPKAEKPKRGSRKTQTAAPQNDNSFGKGSLKPRRTPSKK